jgi:hypothetical protein
MTVGRRTGVGRYKGSYKEIKTKRVYTRLAWSSTGSG